MAVLSETELFADAGVPLRVWDQTAVGPSGPVTAQAVKVMYVISGWGRVDSATDSALIEPGSVVTIPAGVECFGYPQGHARTVTMYVHREYLRGELRWLPRAHPLVHLLDRCVAGAPGLGRLRLPPAVLHDLAPRLVHLANLEPDSSNEFAMLAIASEVAELVGRVSGAHGASHPSLDAAPLLPRREVADAVALLRQHPDHAWSVEELARRVALSSSQLGRVFHDQLGLSPAAYLRQVRADRMAELLSTRRLGIQEAARAVGWDNPVVASRVFKRRYGVSPRTFASTHTRAWPVEPVSLP